MPKYLFDEAEELDRIPPYRVQRVFDNEGNEYIDVRKFVSSDDGGYSGPTKAGITLTPGQVEDLTRILGDLYA